MLKRTTNSSRDSAHNRTKSKQSVVVSLPDQKLTLQDNDKLDHLGEDSFTEFKISRLPWRRSVHLDLPDQHNQAPSDQNVTVLPENGGQEGPELWSSYPVDIKLGFFASNLWLKRLSGRVDGVKVYAGRVAGL